MKKLWQVGLIVFLLLFVLAGCQSTKSSVNEDESENKIEEQNDQATESEMVEEEQTEEKEEEAEESETTVEEKSSEDEQQEQPTEYKEQTVDGITVKISKIQEYTHETVQPSKDRFILVQMEITSEREDTIELSSLRNFSLLVGDEAQDLAYIEGVSELATEIPAGETVTKQIVYDSVNAEEYQLNFQFTEDHPVSWTFSLDSQ